MNRRPQLRIVAPAASPEEAAAVVAALERFMRETAPTPAPVPERLSPWIEAARLEAVERGPRHEPWLGGAATLLPAKGGWPPEAGSGSPAARHAPRCI